MLISQLDVTPMVVEKMKPVDDRLDQKTRRVMNQKSAHATNFSFDYFKSELISFTSVHLDFSHC